ncbi:flagellar biosynthesis protein FlgN [Ruegeria pomeroyi]|uniref:Flagellar biosynthesis protein FlgN n=1 Tax=Ruegeria alba TaxID=2916756 RepID=A0ABS9NV30_9RHOB|nr:flagellar biosynthesis protein FlgN [Ruegeria alba]MCE8512623.1 flagellar biosynthesis protein FlgN [Ruegeria pomeroyi]MCE8529436.1 flagellar biosynthesis protein FlgN [Ruegeria pomeroyi]MCG6558080.1 flagellar biosynthesis protein FlgN [Ruegeria alba]
MDNTDLDDLLSSLDELLEMERAALVRGELEQLGRMTDEKERLVQRINATPDLLHEQLRPLHQKVTRNQVLLNSALEGIRAVSNRMSELRKVRQGLETYDRDGHKHRYAAFGKTQLEKRA